ncbi:MAG: hypothetical protein QM504_02500 [Pseudomonadota bacterium]
MKSQDKEVPTHTIVFFIDKQQFKSDIPDVSVKDLLSQYANEDPSETTLVLNDNGNNLIKFEDDNQMIHLENGMHFVVFHDGPTTVSFNGPQKLLEDLTNLGYEPELVSVASSNQYVIIRNYDIALGRFSKKIIDIGFLATPNFPKSVGSSIHVRSNPQLFEKADTVANIRNIIDSELGNEWLYWSKNFNWNQQQQTARRLMSQIAGVFKNA